jgi:hypothetical protein
LMLYSNSTVIFNVAQSYFNLFTYKPQIGAGILKSIFCLYHFVKTFLTKLNSLTQSPAHIDFSDHGG